MRTSNAVEWHRQIHARKNPVLPLSVVCAVVDGVVVLKRRGWQKTVVGGKMWSLVLVFGYFRFSTVMFCCFLLFVSAFLGFGCLFFGFSTWFWCHSGKVWILHLQNKEKTKHMGLWILCFVCWTTWWNPIGAGRKKKTNPSPLSKPQSLKQTPVP